MSQVDDYSLGNLSFPAARARLNNLFAAIRASNAGPTAPTNPAAGMTWLDTSVSPAVLRQRSGDNTTWLRLSTPFPVPIDLGGTGATTAATARTALGFGSTVLRTLYNTLPVNFSNTTGTFQDIGLSQAITPASAANRILITISVSAFAQRATHHLSVLFELLRGTTTIGHFAFDHVVTGATALFVPIPMHLTQLDSPNTTDAITYSVRARNVVIGNQAEVSALTSSTITLQEIAP